MPANPAAAATPWVSLAVDNKGRLITSSQHHRGLFRLTLPSPAQPQAKVVVERLAVDVGHAHGLLYAFNSLYVVSADDDKEHNGLYRLRDTNGDDQFDMTEFLTWELVANELRNAYDIAFNRQGDLFTYDSDMEWDLGTSWYRPPLVMAPLRQGRCG